VSVRFLSCLVTLTSLALTSCEGSALADSLVVADGRVLDVRGGSRTPAVLLQQAGIKADTDDVFLNLGMQVDAAASIPLGDAIRLQIVNPLPVLINGKPVLSASSTVAAAVRNQGYELHAADLLDPPAETPLTRGMVITFTPAIMIRASADGTARQVRSTSGSTGAALADAGLGLQGLDMSHPSEPAPPVDGGEARVTRAAEAMLLDQVVIPYESQISDSAELEFGLEQVTQPGTAGLAVTATRVRRHDGVEVSRQPAPQAVVQEPQDRIVVRGTRLVETTETIDGTSITYWRNQQMYATIYSPCNSATPDGSCSTGTASGRPAGKGVVAVDPGLYAFLNGQRLYIPGYGFAVIGDVGGGYIIEQNLGISRYKWIDLGFDDNNIQDMTGWVSVYFLAPAPASVPDVLR
jgi:uncharacterized protein YabE (DUF348 family)